MATKEYSNILAYFKNHQDVFDHKGGGWQSELRFEEKVIQMENKRLDNKLSLVKKDHYIINTCIPNYDTGQLISKIEKMVAHYKVNPHPIIESCYTLELAMSYQRLKNTIDCLATYYRYLEPINPEIINDKDKIEEIITIPNSEIDIKKISRDPKLKKLMVIAVLIQILDIRDVDIKGLEEPEIRLINGKPQYVLTINDKITRIIGDSISYKKCRQDIFGIKERISKTLMYDSSQLLNYVMQIDDQKLIMESSDISDKNSDGKIKDKEIINIPGKVIQDKSLPEIHGNGPSNIYEQICSNCGNPIPKDKWRCTDCGGIDKRELS